MSHPLSPTGVLEASLYATDLNRAEEFYGGILGMEKVARVGDRHVFFRAGSTMLLIFNPMETRKPSTNPNLPVPSHGSVGQGHLCFTATADELDAWHAHLSENGITIEADFVWPSGARSIYLRDPADNSIEFAEARLWFDTLIGAS
ncbi:MAG: glyoxalase/bleomycin resistance/extradiol dioxygenase family protein [Rhodobacteraceae bacterium]|nr:glyoxalase/bleomycin resistance/extradiol dioxygenase family protein [Paracoccaceae bacterium]